MSFPDNFVCPITQSIMQDPVIGDDGITYERSAITQWLSLNNTSPVTRQYMSSHLISNLALRNTIQDYLKQTSISTINQKSHTNTQKQSDVDFSYTVKNGYFENDYYSIVGLNFKNTVKKSNIIVAVVDTSGSMGENADVPGAESSGLTRLDLVKHTLNTIVYSLSDNDMLCIVKFSNSAYVISDFIKLSRAGKDVVCENIKKLQPDGMTNLWAGIKLGIDKISSVYNDSSNISMIVMTDGVSNSDPPRGIIPSLYDYINSTKLNFSINTFGYGYNIDSQLLNSISTMSNGIFGFIPDATMVGTIFINMLTSIICGCVNNVEVNTNMQMLTPKTFGMISHNQPIHIVLKSSDTYNDNVFIKFNDKEIQIKCESSREQFNQEELNQIVRINLIKNINEAILNKNNINLLQFKKYLININSTLNSSYIKDVIDDIEFDDPNKGQLCKAVARPDWYEMWGKHYLMSISRAHFLQRCITFKELSPQHYMSDELKVQQTLIEKVFCDLPAPEPSSYYKQNYSQSSQPVSMQTYYVQSGGCFDGNGMVAMYNIDSETLYYKHVNEIKKGDVVYCPLNSEKYSIVKCVIKMKMMKNILMCDFNGMKITPFHPIYINDDWVFPYDIYMPNNTYIDYVYDFVLDSGHCVEINGNNVITLGHGFNFNNIVHHEYFGDKIIDDLMKHSGWDDGYIQLDKYEFVRDKDMRIVKMNF